ncbi:MAG: alpha amylase C-terminal domain-containing protein [Verrucomicrobiaceae bacterium]|nr:alpha amylase C-terminal domain-containing protein [Verrucomicrobiaceae bacterium]
MGSMPVEGGVAFRVWAPHAESVSVVGDFNDWTEGVDAMTREANDTWYTFVEGARVGQGYLYELQTPSGVLKRPDPRARAMENSSSHSLIVRRDAIPEPDRFSPPTLDQLIVYEMHVGSFHVPEGKSHGTFDSAAEKLPYLKDLGINAIELMPVAEFAGDLSWGYNPACPYAVESAYGGPEGLRHLIKEAHAIGIAVIIDVVYNHFGPSDLGLWRFDGWSEGEGGGIYFYNDHRSATPWGNTRPDYGRGEVRTYIRDNAMMWLEEYGADGLRWDMTVFIRSCQGNPGDPMDDLSDGWGLMQWINKEVHQRFPRAITIAEDLRDSEWLVRGVGAGGAGFSTQWNACFVHPIRDVMTRTEDAHRDLAALHAALTCRFDGDAFKRVIYSESHDEVANGNARLPSEIAPDEPTALPAFQRSNLAAALVFTAPGVPMIFQGQEFLQDEWFRDDVPLDWSRLAEFSGVHALYRDLARCRSNAQGVTAGLQGQSIVVHHVEDDRNVVGFRRWREGGKGDDVVVIANLSAFPADDIRIGVPSQGWWRVRLHTDAAVYGAELEGHPCVDTEAIPGDWDGEPFSIQVAVGAYAAAILSQDKSN